MPGILLVIDLIVLALAVYSIRGQREYLRESFLIGFILWGSGVLALTEVLSLFHAIGFWGILIFWVIVLLFCLFIISRNWRNLDIKRLFRPARGAMGARPVRPWPFLEQSFLNRVVFFSFCLGLIALLAPPSTYDAMIYHMSRVMHWIQDRSLTYYPTDIARQLVYPAFAEYVILHFQLLSSGDHWANLVQWLAMCGSLIGVSLIAREIGASRRGQILSALIAVTIPMGVLQATSTQTDYVDTLWLCSIIYFFLCWRRTLGFGYVLLVGASVGLDLATKGIALVYAAPFLGWMVIEAVRRLNIKRALMAGALVLCVAGLFYSGILYRNTVFFHGNSSKFTSMETDSLTTTRFCLEGLLANVLRNTALHLSTPWDGLNTRIEKGINDTASFLHIDLNNKDWTFKGHSFLIFSFRSDEDITGNLLHVFLFGAVLLLFAFSSRFRGRDAGFYLAACLLSWTAFNLLLKWQQYHSRFHLGMFVIFAPLAGYVLERIKTRWLVSGIMGGLFLSAWVFVFLNVSKQICSTMSVFRLENRPGLYFIRGGSPQATFEEYQVIAYSIKKMGLKNIGLITKNDEPEYLLWVALNPTADRSMRIESVLVSNASADLNYPLGDFIPDAIISINDDRPGVSLGNNIYQMVWHNEIGKRRVSILMKSPS
jgi:hypothetical protein